MTKKSKTAILWPEVYVADEHFRLKYWAYPQTLCITFPNKRHNYVPGDCYVSALRASSDPSQADAHAPHGQKYTEPMTFEAVRAFIAAQPSLLGEEINDCVGIVLIEDKHRPLDFENPIQVRNQTP